MGRNFLYRVAYVTGRGFTNDPKATVGGAFKGPLVLVAFLTEADPIQRILNHIGEPVTPPQIALARGPPDWFDEDFDQTDLNESEQVEPVPEFEFDQTVSW